MMLQVIAEQIRAVGTRETRKACFFQPSKLKCISSES
jgi:hypothetical protein